MASIEIKIIVDGVEYEFVPKDSAAPIAAIATDAPVDATQTTVANTPTDAQA